MSSSVRGMTMKALEGQHADTGSSVDGEPWERLEDGGCENLGSAVLNVLELLDAPAIVPMRRALQ